MADPHPFDTLTEADLRTRGSLKWTLFGERSLGAFIAEMDFGTAPPVLEALHAAVDTMNFGYLPPGLTRAMAEACADWQRRRYGWQVRAEDVHPLPDVMKGLEVAIAHFSKPDSPVILPTPAYMPFLTVPGILGRTTIQVPMVRADDRYVLDLDGLAAAFRQGGDLLILCNPYNPVGRVFTRDELVAVCEVVDHYGGRVFADEIHAPLIYPGYRHVPYASISETAAEHTLTATSASKAWNLPGLMCAQLIVSNAEDARALAELHPFVTHGASNLGVIATTAAYTAGEEWLADVLDYLDGNRRELVRLVDEHLPGVQFDPPEGTYLAWLDFRELGLGDNPGVLIKERTGVVLVDGPECGPPGRGHARLNFATPRPVLARIVETMATALRPGG